MKFEKKWLTRVKSLKSLMAAGLPEIYLVYFWQRR